MDMCCLAGKELAEGKSCLVLHTADLNTEFLSEKH